jgi:hypothetical protein
LAPVGVIVAVAVMYACVEVAPRSLGFASWLTIGLGAIWWLAWTPYQVVVLFSTCSTVDQAKVDYYRQARALAERHDCSQPVVVGYHPYFFTRATGAPALAIPYSDDVYLIDYMRRYGACWVFLTPAELDFWRPSWREPGNLPPQLRFVELLGNCKVYERADPLP